jgi:hypothetical protein
MLVCGVALVAATYWFAYLFPLNILFLVFGVNVLVKTLLNWRGSLERQLLLRLMDGKQDLPEN